MTVVISPNLYTVFLEVLYPCAESCLFCNKLPTLFLDSWDTMFDTKFGRHAQSFDVENLFYVYTRNALHCTTYFKAAKPSHAGAIHILPLRKFVKLFGLTGELIRWYFQTLVLTASQNTEKHLVTCNLKIWIKYFKFQVVSNIPQI